MIGNIGSKGKMMRAAALMAALSASVAGVPAGALVGGSVAPPSIKLAMPLPGVRRNKRRRENQTRAQATRGYFRWQGVGMLAMGPRWPSSKPVTREPGNIIYKASDDSQYIRMTDRSLRRYGKVKGKAAKRYVKAMRHNPHTVSNALRLRAVGRRFA